MIKYQQFEQYYNNLPGQEDDLRQKLADTEIKIKLLESEKKTVTSMIDFRLTNMPQDPEGKKETQAKIEALQVRYNDAQEVLDAALKEKEMLEEALSDSLLQKLAGEAVDEQYQEVIDMQVAFTDKIKAAQKAKETYLNYIVEIGIIRNEGLHIIERLNKAVFSAKRPMPSYAQFETALSPFLVELADIKTPYYRGVLK